MKVSARHKEAIEAEVRRWPGVSVSWHMGGKHPYAELAFDGHTQRQTIPGTSSDGARGHLNAVSDTRRILTSMGASRAEDRFFDPVTPRSRRRKRIQRSVTMPTISDPRPDGFAALRELSARMESERALPTTGLAEMVGNARESLGPDQRASQSRTKTAYQMLKECFRWAEKSWI